MSYKKNFCIQCKKEVTKKNADTYCSNKCQAKHRYETKTKPNVLAGGLSDAKTKKKVLISVHGEKCEQCSIPAQWNGKPLSLQVDHIDGDSDNNKFSNLRLLCPNCHTQTDTFGSKGRGNTIKKFTKRNNYLREHKGYGPVV